MSVMTYPSEDKSFVIYAILNTYAIVLAVG